MKTVLKYFICFNWSQVGGQRVGGWWVSGKPVHGLEVGGRWVCSDMVGEFVVGGW